MGFPISKISVRVDSSLLTNGINNIIPPGKPVCVCVCVRLFSHELAVKMGQETRRMDDHQSALPGRRSGNAANYDADNKQSQHTAYFFKNIYIYELVLQSLKVT